MYSFAFPVSVEVFARNYTELCYKDLNKRARDSIPVSLTKAEIAEYVARFNALDEGRKGFISINDIRKSLKVTVKHFWLNLNSDFMEELLLRGVGLCCNGCLDPGRAHKGGADTRAVERVGHQQERAGGGGGIPTDDVCTQGKTHKHYRPVVKPVQGLH